MQFQCILLANTFYFNFLILYNFSDLFSFYTLELIWRLFRTYIYKYLCKLSIFYWLILNYVHFHFLRPLKYFWPVFCRQTGVLSNPVVSLVTASEVRFWKCAHRLKDMVQSGRCLPGAGVPERTAMKRLLKMKGKWLVKGTVAKELKMMTFMKRW